MTAVTDVWDALHLDQVVRDMRAHVGRHIALTIQAGMRQRTVLSRDTVLRSADLSGDELSRLEDRAVVLWFDNDNRDAADPYMQDSVRLPLDEIASVEIGVTSSWTFRLGGIEVRVTRCWHPDDEDY